MQGSNPPTGALYMQLAQIPHTHHTTPRATGDASTFARDLFQRVRQISAVLVCCVSGVYDIVVPPHAGGALLVNGYKPPVHFQWVIFVSLSFIAPLFLPSIPKEARESDQLEATSRILYCCC